MERGDEAGVTVRQIEDLVVGVRVLLVLVEQVGLVALEHLGDVAAPAQIDLEGTQHIGVEWTHGLLDAQRIVVRELEDDRELELDDVVERGEDELEDALRVDRLQWW